VDTQKFKMGWLLVAFDLPVLSKEQRKRASGFREFLIDDGFLMIQFSVYARSCVSIARQETHMARVRAAVPPEGNVRGIFITRAQWERSFVCAGPPLSEKSPEPIPDQLQFW
jgi:CRISPR-associated protein Cas2